MFEGAVGISGSHLSLFKSNLLQYLGWLRVSGGHEG